ncbi:transcription initiation factor IIA, gamma subunit-domain-containing protein [Boeremia exigua]|uniref:transcription initiation factor IIA, gamma subunit-domain-containing protein n=1 Tax=Boeremia exigua TaxID=749465 RepID=UPI001E8D0DA4|nr:transcription initiation factor IIA, gamma subunit-domain-containing protein [Boeremia exigua]KAH6613984.1 transcription initiation factor IIA, gamma subunit-domain-containing protein [Boeremia exigua]
MMLQSARTCRTGLAPYRLSASTIGSRPSPEHQPTRLVAVNMAADLKYYELYRRNSLGGALTDTLDNLITERRIEPQLAMKILANFDKAVADVLADKVKARLTFKGHLDTYRFCDDVWTFIIKDINFKLDNTNQVHADRVKIVSCNTKRPGEV